MIPMPMWCQICKANLLICRDSTCLKMVSRIHVKEPRIRTKNKKNTTSKPQTLEPELTFCFNLYRLHNQIEIDLSKDKINYIGSEFPTS